MIHSAVRMTAKALVEPASDPARAHAIDLTLIGHLIQSRLIADGVCDDKANFARVWRDHVVPAAAESRTDWQVGMCAGIYGLKTGAGLAFNGVVSTIITLGIEIVLTI